MTNAYWKERLSRATASKEITMTDKYNILQREVEEAEKVLAEAQAKLDKLNKDETISPEEVLMELKRMASCPDWSKTPPKDIGTILMKNIFNNRELEKERDSSLYDRDY